MLWHLFARRPPHPPASDLPAEPPLDDAPVPVRRRGQAAARPRGTPRDGATPRMETVRVTAPDLQRRAVMARTRGRIRWAGYGFIGLFALLGAKLTLATVILPEKPPPARADGLVPVLEAEVPRLDQPPAASANADAPRAAIEDRNGQLLAVSLPTAEVYADPREMADVDDVVRKLHQVLPNLDADVTRERLNRDKKSFVWIARQITPQQEVAINHLGIPGIYFRDTGRRYYPLGRVAAQVLGAVDVDQHGVAGVEKAFDQRLSSDSTPLRLSIDLRVQAVVRDELQQAVQEFNPIGAAGIVMDVNTNEVIAMVSLPDYDANDFGKADPNSRFNRAVTGMYEPGSTFKLQTAAMALDSGAVKLTDWFDAIHPIHIGRFTITDYQGKHRMLALPEVLTFSSNLGAAHIAMDVGAQRQQAWLRAMGMFDKLPVQLPEAGRPLHPPFSNWGEAAVMTVGFGHGIAVSPLHIVRGVATLVDGGILRPPTMLALDPDAAPPAGTRLMQQQTSDTIRKLMRLVVTDGYGKPADVVGYFVGGKTGTAEVVSHGTYEKHTNIAAFISVYPMNAPRYAVYMMLDEPHATAATHGYTTAAWIAAPVAAKVIARTAPMLGLFPVTGPAGDAVQASLYMPVEPSKMPAQPSHPASEADSPAPQANTKPPQANTKPPQASSPGDEPVAARRHVPETTPASMPATMIPTTVPRRAVPHQETALPTRAAALDGATRVAALDGTAPLVTAGSDAAH
jgi:cell division protein FtsI (penicillin-binding protein 3)